MELNKTIEKIIKYLPFESAANFLDREEKSKFAALKFIGHMVYAAAAPLLFIVPIIILTGEYPSRPREVLRATAVKSEDFKRYNELRDKILGENGLADLNKDGDISLEEQADAWKRMGLDNKTSSRATIFPRPTLEQLETAVRSYEEDLRK